MDEIVIPSNRSVLSIGGQRTPPSSRLEVNSASHRPQSSSSTLLTAGHHNAAVERIPPRLNRHWRGGF